MEGVIENMTRNEFEDDYCKYYFALEEDFEKTLRYVEVHADNFDTYSFEYLRQIQVICAEFDSLSKEICGIPQTERKNITDYYAGLEAHAWGARQLEILLEMAKQENGFSRGYHKAQEIRAQMDGDELTVSITKGGDATVVKLDDAQIDQARISVSEKEAIAIAKRAFAQEYGLTQAQLDAMIYEKDYAGYTYAIREGKTICEVWFWLHQDEDVVHADGDGLYWARINAESGVVEEMMYDSALAGNG